MSRYSWKRKHPMQRIREVDEVPSRLKDCDNRLSVMLLKSLPEKMKNRVFEEADGAMGVDISTSYVLDTVWEDVAPGGQEELHNLTR
eukprot:4668488-Prorocentrum_lima.AAC.1